MTNEKAITELSVLWERMKRAKESGVLAYKTIMFYDGQYVEALDLAIKALEQQPCEDCISRAEALKHSHIEYDDDGEGHRVVYVEEIEALPPVTPQQTRWIPCSERMPEVSDYYLIQHSRHICSDEMAVAYYSVEEAELDENYTWEFKPFADCKEVIAWMPLPKSYKEDEQNES